jgi:hypothetical protein
MIKEEEREGCRGMGLPGPKSTPESPNAGARTLFDVLASSTEKSGRDDSKFLYANIKHEKESQDADSSIALRIERSASSRARITLRKPGRPSMFN